MPAKRRAPHREREPAEPQKPHPEPPARRYRPVTRKQRTFYMSDDLFARIQAAVVSLAGPPEALSMTKFLERAALRELARLERTYHKGTPFPPLAAGDGPRRGARPGVSR